MARIAPFEKYTDRYDAWFVMHQAAYLSELEAVRQMLPQHGTGIEIGAGTGRFAAPLEISFGIEPCTAMSKTAVQRGVRIISGVGEYLPVRSGIFHYALMVTTVCFLDNIPQAFGEMNRILHPGGSVLIGFVDRESVLGAMYESEKQKSRFYGDARFYSVGEITQYLETAGFSRFQYRQTLFSPLEKIRKAEPVKPGFGEGSFVAVSAVKRRI